MTKVQFGSHPEDIKRFTTDELRDRFLIPEILKSGEINAVYTMHDRMIVLGAVPLKEALKISAYEELTKSFFLLVAN